MEVQQNYRAVDGARREEVSRGQRLVTSWPPVKTDPEEGCSIVIFLVVRQSEYELIGDVLEE